MQKLPDWMALKVGRAYVLAVLLALRSEVTQAHQIDLPQTSAYDLLIALEQMPGIP
jgi:hypothetical protein